VRSNPNGAQGGSFKKIQTGVDVLIAHFRPKILAFFFKKCYDPIFQNLTVFKQNKKRLFLPFFSKIFKNHSIGPRMIIA
jgi:hypothetical protein